MLAPETYAFSRMVYMKVDILKEFKEKLSFSRITFSHIDSKVLFPKWLGLYQEVFCLSNSIYFDESDFLNFDWSDHIINNDFDRDLECTYLCRSLKAACDTGSLYFDIGTLPFIRNIQSSCIILLDHKDLIENASNVYGSKKKETGKLKESMNCINLFDLPKWSHIIFL
jgi:hypothetical protein